ncbi:MAG: hypothetical protein WD295_03835, partial [Bacteroidota bacterium]
MNTTQFRTRVVVTRWVAAILLALVPVTMLRGQGERQQPADADIPTFHFDAISYRADEKDKSRIDIYVQIPHEELRFVKEGDQYVARYEVLLTIHTASKDLVVERTWNEQVPVSTFDQTTSNKLYRLTQRAVDVAPGNYLVAVQLKDMETRKTARIQRAMLVTDFQQDSL